MTVSQTRSIARLTALALIPLLLGLGSVGKASNGPSRGTNGISKIAADSCSEKVKRLEANGAKPTAGKKKTTQISEAEINSYLALELSQKYHPSLKNMVVTFEESRLQGVATLDFDQLGMNSKSVMAKMMAKLFSGIHKLTVRGKLRANEGKANFQLDEARFDDNVLPNFLVEEIISAVGRKQKPPFDPMQPSQMPYGIQSVEVHAGHILVHQ